MRFSIVIPTYNEEADIAATLDSLIDLRGDREILVVDDSTDRTPEIVASYALHGVQLIHPGGGGRCEARNLGISRASGEVVCILNADVRLPPDFLERLEPHYAAGAGYVLVNAAITNVDRLCARYVEAESRRFYARSDLVDAMQWTEGFSARRDLLARCRGFPTGFAVPICAGEDGWFGDDLRASGAKRVHDPTIVVTHVAPAAFPEYWRIRKGRGAGSPQCHRFLHGWSWTRILAWNAAKLAKDAALGAMVLPLLAAAARAALHSPRGAADTLPFAWAIAVERAAFHAGVWSEIRRIRRHERARRAAAG